MHFAPGICKMTLPPELYNTPPRTSLSLVPNAPNDKVLYARQLCHHPPRFGESRRLLEPMRVTKGRT